MKESFFPSHLSCSRLWRSVSRLNSTLQTIQIASDTPFQIRANHTVFGRSLLLVLSMLFSPSIFAQREICDINPAASRVSFVLGNSNHGIGGTFHLEAGVIQFDPTLSNISGFVVIAAETVKTGSGNLDKKAAETLDVSEYGNILFVPKSYQGSIGPSGESDIRVSGTLTLRGMPYNFTVPAQFNVDRTMCAAKVHFIIPYVKWGLKDPRIFIFRAAKEVQVNLTFSGKLSGAHGL
jgi:polyisoprenoid-binding protein YceI